MSRSFANPSNGHQETVGSGDSVAVFFLGLFYLMYKGLWGHVFIWLMLVVVPTIASGEPFFIFTLPAASIGYAIGVQQILANRYLANGWSEVSHDESSAGNKRDDIPAGTPQPTPPCALGATTEAAKPITKQCPYCAEEVKFEAIKCKHCQSDLLLQGAEKPVAP